jgi:hypothetical protein
MAAERRRNGRRQGPPLGASPAMDELVLYLRSLRDGAGLSVSRLHVLLAETIRSSDSLGMVPAEPTLHRLLRGENLHTAPRIVDAVVDICVRITEGDAEAAHERVQKLRILAREQMAAPAPEPNPQQPSDPHGRERRFVEALAQRQKTLEEENLRLTVELAAARQLLSASAASTPSAADPEAKEPGDLDVQVQRVAEAAQEALAEARAARGEIAGLRESLASAARTDVHPDERSGTVVHELVRPERGRHAERHVLETATTPPRKAAVDQELDHLVSRMVILDSAGTKMAGVIEGAGAYLLDGERTGRFDWDELSKGEKTLFTPIVSRLMRRDFALEDSRDTSFMLDGIGFDVLFSRPRFRWSFPRELVGRLCVVIHADDKTGRFGYGIVRVDDEYLNSGGNRDGRRMLSSRGRDAIRWIHDDAVFAASVLWRLDPTSREAILRNRSSVDRVAELFRRVQGSIISRTDVATVALQADPTRRLRDARVQLGEEGIALLSDRPPERAILRALGLPVPGPRNWVSVRIAAADDDDPGPVVELRGKAWRRALPEDPETPLPWDWAL